MPLELHRAISDGDTNLAKKLIETGTDVNQDDESGVIPLQYAVVKNNVEVVDLLLKYDAKIISNGLDIFFIALQKIPLEKTEGREFNDDEKLKNFKILEKMIQHGVKVNEPRSGYLIMALLTNYVPIIELLLVNGAPITDDHFKIDSIGDLCTDAKENRYTINKTLITQGILNRELKEKSDFIKEDKELSSHWNEIQRKINYLQENPIIAVKERTKEILAEGLFLRKNSLKALSFSRFFKPNENVNKTDETISNVALISKLH